MRQGFDQSYVLEKALRAKKQLKQEATNKRIAEERILRDKEKNGEVLSPIIEQGYAETKRKFKDPAYAVDMDSFKKRIDGDKEEGVYPESEVESDKAEVARLAKIFEERNSPQEKNAKKMADVFEAVMLDQAELSDWLGENVKTVRTTPWDDYKNGVDMYAEWASTQEGLRLLALAVDITFSAVSLGKKMDRIKSEIDRDELSQIKYFKDEHGDFMGKRNNVPRVVIGVSPRLVTELAALWIQKDNKKLGAHPVQRLIVEQIHEQMLTMHAYAKANNKDNAARAYEQALAIVGPLAEQKADTKNGGVELGMTAYDSVASAIKLRTRSTFALEKVKPHTV